MSLELAGLTCRYAAGGGISNISARLAPGEILVVLGASGSGKTTLLRAIAGLVRPQSGRVLCDGLDVTETPTQERRIALTFQNPALIPSGDVRFNLLFARLCEDRAWLKLFLRRAGEAHANDVEGVARALAIEPLLSRSVVNLSGGEAQRVALGRVLLQHANVYLFDEPFTGLDPRLRTVLIEQLDQLRSRRRPMVLVSHDLDEAFALADQILVLRDGVTEYYGNAAGVLDAPPNLFVARFVYGHFLNVLPCVPDRWPPWLRAQLRGADVPELPRNDDASLAFPPEALCVSPASADDGVEVIKVARSPRGVVVYLDAGGAVKPVLASSPVLYPIGTRLTVSLNWTLTWVFRDER